MSTDAERLKAHGFVVEENDNNDQSDPEWEQSKTAYWKGDESDAVILVYAKKTYENTRGMRIVVTKGAHQLFLEKGYKPQIAGEAIERLNSNDIKVIAYNHVDFLKFLEKLESSGEQ